jgi:hypothetical protein
MTLTTKVTGVCTATLLLLMFLTQPDQLPAIILVAPFMLLFVTLFLISNLLLKRPDAPRAKRLKVSILIAGFPTILLVMRSLGQLTVRDILAMLALFCIGYFYIGRLARQPAS